MAFELPSLPNFSAAVPQTPSPLDSYAKMLQLKSLMGQQQMMPYQLQEQQLRNQQLETANQVAEIDLKAKQAYNNYWSNPDKFSSDASDFQHNDAFASMLGIAPNDPLMSIVRGQIKAGVPADHAFAEAKNTLDVRKTAMTATEEQQKVWDSALGHLKQISAPILAEKDATKKQALIGDALPGLAEWAKFDPSLAPYIPQLNAGNFGAFANRLGAEKDAIDYAKSQSDAMTARQKVIDASGTSPEQRGEARRQISVETDPRVIAAKVQEAAARQNAIQNPPVPGNTQLTGDAYIQSLPAAMQDNVRSIGTGKMALSRIDYLLSRNPALMDAVSHAYPDFDSSKVKSYSDTYKDYTSGKTSVALNAGGTGLGHLKELEELNTAASHIPHTPAWTAYQNKATTVATELAKFYGDATVSGIDAIKNTLTSTLPGTREAAIRTQAQSMGDKLDAYEQQWKNAAPSAAYQAPMPGISAAAKTARAALDPEYAKRIQGQAAGGGMIYARDPLGKLHQAPAGTALPQGWKLEQR